MERIKERQNRVWESISYSSQRMDLLIISICGAGIYTCFETIKYLKENELPIHWLIKLSGGLFLFSIVSNFISQMGNYKTNVHDYKVCDLKLDNIESPSDKTQNNIKFYRSKYKRSSKVSDISHYISIGIMFFGLTALTFYFIFIF